MGTGKIEEGFELVSEEELDMAIEYVAKKDFVALNRTRLRVIANNAGKTRIVKRVAPRVAASRAMQNYHNEFPAVRFPTDFFEGYVHAVAKILNSRSPHVAAKRRIDERKADLRAAGYGLSKSPPMQAAIQQELEEMIELRKLQSKNQKADT